MDKLSPTQRSANMRAIRSKNTRPEQAVRRALRCIGLPGYRLHRKDLPGCPDVAFVGRKKAIFVNGCFWHGHNCKRGLRRPKSREAYWLSKIAGNQARDLRHKQALDALGWDVFVIWECDCKAADLPDRLSAFVLGETSVG